MRDGFFVVIFAIFRIAYGFDYALAKLALEFSAAAYAIDPWPCALKNNGTVLYVKTAKCDVLNDECWSVIGATKTELFVSFSGTKSKEQLVTELLESIGRPKHKLHNAGSVHYYFYSALKSMWHSLSAVLNEFVDIMPKHRIVFTGHSLGGALASIASTIFAQNHPQMSNRTFLITFGQPRVGNIEYAMRHDELVAGGSWRIVHAIDIVAHIPMCVERLTRPISCIPFYNHGSYHHGTEIWFPANMTDGDEYRVCDGTPINEDNSCSNAQRFYDINDHLFYFGHHVSNYGDNGCVDD
ncbi:unnamed protein product [Caenorhabditis bovis]|uniref:Fungal lipase-type domain-containing protein n=1 Tax=Caenorhabditis bovis TaxID=2654633 RepID=A0A8S1F1G0_9PELO|nr:unnamed protein product [Caenorhabditis bovis]